MKDFQRNMLLTDNEGCFSDAIVTIEVEAKNYEAFLNACRLAKEAGIETFVANPWFDLASSFKAIADDEILPCDGISDLEDHEVACNHYYTFYWNLRNSELVFEVAFKHTAGSFEGQISFLGDEMESFFANK